MNAPVLGAEAGYPAPGTWSTAFSWRYQNSSRHFRGNQEQSYRKAEGSSVINDINMFEVAATRQITERFSVSIGIPYFLMERSQPLRDPSLPDNVFGNSPVVDRTTTQSRGLGDITVTPRWWVFKPSTHPDYNLALGLGIKLPTGENSVEDTFQVRVDDPNSTTEPFKETNVVRTVDQSIQPGDGGFGIVMDLQGFRRFAHNRAAAYLTCTYLANPENVSEVATYRGGDSALAGPDGDPPAGSEAFMSVADQYLARVGATWFPTSKIGLSLGGRWEGVPVRDWIGGSDGFRRPGYAFSIEPGISYTIGSSTFALNVPIAAHRNRKRSVPDVEDNGAGDAAFADYVIILSYSRSLGGAETPQGGGP